MKEIRNIKGLNSQLKIMQADADLLKYELSNKQKEYLSKRNKIKYLKQEIESIENNQNIKVSQHAIVRYFERVKGFDIKEVEKDILTKEVLNLVEKLGGTGGYPNKDFRVIMKNFTVTTVINL